MLHNLTFCINFMGRCVSRLFDISCTRTFIPYIINKFNVFFSPAENNRLIYPAEMAGSIGSDASDIVQVLTTRLDKAERRLKLLHCEVKDIRNQLVAFQTKGSVAEGTKRPLREDISTNYNIALRRFSTNGTETCDSSSLSKKSKYTFTYEDDYVVAFVDGACENNGKKGAKAGIGVWFGENHPLNVSAPVRGRATNNTGEIQASIAAIKIAHKEGIRKLKIKSDSQFVISAITIWIKKWKLNNWKTASGETVKNKEDFIILDEVLKLLDDVCWVKVAGHKGIFGNEQADKLAVAGAALYV